MPLLLLGAAYTALPHIDFLEKAAPKALFLLPYIIFSFGIMLSLHFNLTRVAFVLFVFGLACWGHHATASVDATGFASSVIFLSICFLLPFNLALFALLRERGIATLQGGLRFGYILFQALLIFWVIQGSREDIYRLLSGDFFLSLPFPGSHALPQSALIMNGLAFLLIFSVFRRKCSPVEIGFIGAQGAVILASLFAERETYFILFLSAAGLILLVSVIQNTYHMAYRDDLTGLPARRALNERTLMLGRRYSIAMLDVDHFKKFNDTYGHATGDQVLKMVATGIRKVGGGGRSYRYGGEEFTILFPNRGLDAVVPHLEELRERIEAYRLGIRGKDRPEKSMHGRSRRGAKGKGKAVSVTVSIGVAESGKQRRSPDEVISAADKALYRAKKSGRNRVCR